ncbi:hypothetical protein GA0115240_14098 [Streptomyces sp. DvalAA-14]|nr:hypothetical protein GA0115240_14098 [Streptomyces sp. DvalAA-14]
MRPRCCGPAPSRRSVAARAWHLAQTSGPSTRRPGTGRMPVVESSRRRSRCRSHRRPRAHRRIRVPVVTRRAPRPSSCFRSGRKPRGADRSYRAPRHRIRRSRAAAGPAHGPDPSRFRQPGRCRPAVRRDGTRADFSGRTLDVPMMQDIVSRRSTPMKRFSYGRVNVELGTRGSRRRPSAAPPVHPALTAYSPGHGGPARHRRAPAPPGTPGSVEEPGRENPAADPAADPAGKPRPGARHRRPAGVRERLTRPGPDLRGGTPAHRPGRPARTADRRRQRSGPARSWRHITEESRHWEEP